VPKKKTEEDLQAAWKRYLLFKAILGKVKPVFRRTPGCYFRVYSDSFSEKRRGYKRKSVRIYGFTEQGYAFLIPYCDSYTGRYNFTVPLETPTASPDIIAKIKLPKDIEDKIKLFRVESRLDKKTYED
jgi:hypothetical protein